MSASERLHQLLAPLPDGATVPVGWVRAQLGVPDEPEEAPADFSCGQAATLLGRKASTVRNWCASGRLPGAYRLLGREWRIPSARFRAFQESQAQRQPAALASAPAVDLSSWQGIHPATRRNKPKPKAKR